LRQPPDTRRHTETDARSFVGADRAVDAAVEAPARAVPSGIRVVAADDLAGVRR